MGCAVEKILVLTLGCCAGQALAQLPVPDVAKAPVTIPAIRSATGELLSNAADLGDRTLQELARARELRIVRLAREHRAELDRNGAGELVVRAEVIAIDITPQALQRALSVMHHFGGRLADTLVGLDLLDPLEAYRLLAKQVAAKLMEAFSWQKGRYTWTPRHPNPWKTRSLHLDAFRVIGAGAAQLGTAFVEEWLATNGRAFATREPAQDGELAQFGLGEALLRVYSLLDGRTRLGDLAARVRSPEARTNLLRLTYLLVQTELARLS